MEFQKRKYPGQGSQKRTTNTEHCLVSARIFLTPVVCGSHAAFDQAEIGQLFQKSGAEIGKMVSVSRFVLFLPRSLNLVPCFSLF